MCYALRAAMSVVQIETSRSATAWATGCVWTAHLWPALHCTVPALNPLKANYTTITVITSPTMTMEQPVVDGARERGMPSALHSFSAALLFSQLVPAVAIDIITVVATERQRVSTDEFLLWRN